MAKFIVYGQNQHGNETSFEVEANSFYVQERGDLVFTLEANQVTFDVPTVAAVAAGHWTSVKKND